jgi:hypothetical protein
MSRSDPDPSKIVLPGNLGIRIRGSETKRNTYGSTTLLTVCRGKLCEHLSEREDWSPEAVVELEFVNKSAAPKPESSLNHDDWVSACRFAISPLFIRGT